MERRSQGQRLLDFHRAHGIADSRAHAPVQPASPPRHVVHGARQCRQLVVRDAPLTILMAAVTVVLALIVAALFSGPQAPMATDLDSPTAEVAR